SFQPARATPPPVAPDPRLAERAAAFAPFIDELFGALARAAGLTPEAYRARLRAALDAELAVDVTLRLLASTYEHEAGLRLGAALARAMDAERRARIDDGTTEDAIVEKTCKAH